MGDESDASSFQAFVVRGLSTWALVRHMGGLIRLLEPLDGQAASSRSQPR